MQQNGRKFVWETFAAAVSAFDWPSKELCTSVYSCVSISADQQSSSSSTHESLDTAQALSILSDGTTKRTISFFLFFFLFLCWEG